MLTGVDTMMRLARKFRGSKRWNGNRESSWVCWKSSGPKGIPAFLCQIFGHDKCFGANRLLALENEIKTGMRGMWQRVGAGGMRRMKLLRGLVCPNPKLLGGRRATSQVWCTWLGWPRVLDQAARG
jgi:hypothetical protein